ncbi:MAG: SDR family NAD(P)-dependent oxidoreductase [Nevskiales bacterium]|nr:SDR family NAD(P)-dependent oxidoreductase [Nevskiales bacterium]
MYKLKDKVAVITGAGSGIGRALALQLANKGCRLALSDVNEDGLAETASMLPQTPFTQRLDVADREAVYAHADAVQREFGTAHVVINNAGVALSQTIEDMSYDDFEWLMGINFWGVVYGTKAFLPMLRAQDDGAIVNLSSIFGIITLPTQGAYHAAKFAVRGFTETLRQELAGTGVFAVSIHPGGIKTNIARSARFYVSPTGDKDREKTNQDFDKLARTTPEQAAAAIIDGIEHKRPRVLIGGDAKLLDKVQRWMPESYPKLVSKFVELGRR